MGSVHDISLTSVRVASVRVAGVQGGERLRRLFNPMCCSDEHSTTAAAALDATWQVDRALPSPVGDERIEGVNVTGDQRAGRTACLDRKQAPDAAADGPGQSEQAQGVDRLRSQLGPCRRGKIVQRVGVITKQVGRTRQRRNGSQAKFCLKNRQQSTCPNPTV